LSDWIPSLTDWCAQVKLLRLYEYNRQLSKVEKYFEEEHMNQEIFESIQEIVADLLDIDPETITPESKFQADLGADSLDLVELIMEFEERFGGEISDEDAQKITTVGEAVKYVEERM
jgi:acyl carrier protein